MKRLEIQLQDLAHAIARVLIASFFLAKATGFIFDANSMDLVFQATALPDYFRWPDMAFQLTAAAFILIGFQTRLAACLLALHLFWSSLIFNYVPGDPVAIAALWKDLALIGGLMMLYAHDRGAFALDNRLLDTDAAAEAADAPSDPADHGEIAVETIAASLNEPAGAAPRG